MASKRRIRRNACDGKRRYETQEMAELKRKDIYVFNFKHNCPSASEHLQVYHCKFCNGYHLGHRKIR